MHYEQYSAMNFPIGSGVTEAACKSLIKQRLCQSGMKWKNRGVTMVLRLRGYPKNTILPYEPYTELMDSQ